MIPYMQDLAVVLVPQATRGLGGGQTVQYNRSADNIKVRRGPASGNSIREVDGTAYNPTEVIATTDTTIDIKYKLHFAEDNVTLLIVGRRKIMRGNLYSHYELEGVRVDR